MAIEEWWTTNRPRAPMLFTDELDEVVARLGEYPRVGTDYAPYPGIRRLLLPRSGYHVYTTEDAATVQIVAVWSALRADRPRLPRS